MNILDDVIKMAYKIEPNPRNWKFEYRNGRPFMVSNCETLSFLLKESGFSHMMTEQNSMSRHSVFRGETYMGEFNADEAWELLRDLRPDLFERVEL